MEYRHLDSSTRQLMLSELDADINNAVLYLSPRLSEIGRQQYPGFLKTAFTNQEEDWLAEALEAPGFLLDLESYVRNGVSRTRAVPKNAARTLARGEFNTYYMRALCLRASADKKQVEVFRAGNPDYPRPESEALIGTRPEPEQLLQWLRLSPTERRGSALPAPNSGLSLLIID